MKKEKIAIFGGSFDPVHFGHIDIVNNLSKLFTKVIVVPTAASPFKANGAASEKQARLKMCKAAFKGENVKVSNIEIKRDGISYSVDTARAFAKKFKAAELYWVIGSEEVAKLEQWNRIDELASLVTFYIIERPSFPLAHERLKELKAEGIKAKRAPFTGLDISSSLVKLDTAFSKPNKFVPVKIYALAKTFDVYGKYVNALYKYGVKPHRIEHIYRVCKAGINLAKAYGESVENTIIACILHDVAKSQTDPALAEGAPEDMPEQCLHGYVGAKIAKRDFNVSDEIAHAIEVHTTADADMSTLDKIVYLADKIEEGRCFDGVDELRYLCYYDMDMAVEYQLKREKGRGKEFYRKGDEALAMFTLINEGKPAPVFPEYKYEEKQAEDTKKEKPKKALTLKTEIKTIAKCLSDKKGMEIDIMDVSTKSAPCDCFIIATATSTAHVRALYEAVDEKMSKDYGIEPLRRDIDSTWIAIDYGDIIVHIFKKDAREFYKIERLWSDENNVVRFED